MKLRLPLAVIVCVVWLLGGCASETRTNRLQLGMARAEVLSIMGQPQNTRASGQTEYLVYRLRDSIGNPSEFFVRIVDGKVDAYGRPGDFSESSLRLIIEGK